VNETIHGGCVAVEGRGLLILGPAGSGKSSLALELIALGAELVADDRVALRAEAGGLRASAPAALRGLIEARGLGLLRLPAAAEARVALAVDLAPSPERLPARRAFRALGAAAPLVNAPLAARAAALFAALRWGAPLDPDAAAGISQ
jgi:HPr kinase/phosphorylase